MTNHAKTKQTSLNPRRGFSVLCPGNAVSQIVCVVLCAGALLFPLKVNAQIIKPAVKTYDQLADAIFLAEGNYKTAYPYGIKSVSCSGLSECRRVCINTIRNNVKRWNTAKAGGDKRDYLTFLRDRYAPLSDSSLNEHWLRNVRYFLNKGGGI